MGVLEDDSQLQPNGRPTHGRIIGYKYLEKQGDKSSRPPHGNLEKVDVDIPETTTELRTIKGEEYVVLGFTPDDPQDPFNWTRKRKATISIALCLMTLFVGLGTTAYSSTIARMTKDLGVSVELGQLGLFTFNMACALAPLFLAPFCEMVGRRIVYVSAFALYIVVFVGLALGHNIATILVMRTLSGLFGSVGTILVGGTFSDIYRPDFRARPMALFSYVAILGTVAAPIYAGFIDETLGWRWVEGIQGLASVPVLIFVFFVLRETRGSVTLSHRANALREATGDERYKTEVELQETSLKKMLHDSSVKAAHMLVTEPVVFWFGLWIAFAWFVTFLFLSVIPITFEEKRGWREGIAGLPYISLSIGSTLGFAANFLQSWKYNSVSKACKAKNVPVPPEARLYGAMFGACFLPIGLFIYSFTQYRGLSWVGPAIALAPIAFGIFFIFESTYSYTSDCYGESSSSAIAAQGFFRNTLGAVSPLFASQFFHNVGSQYAGLILSLIGTVLSFIPLIMFKYGPALRAHSQLARTVKEG
ncbi:major facilitator superfamily domain-containing protein [Phialemonium atrogriseum]|uniref:Major facilitator superfamily domain-containing protein n=1 Tax=Phialemonium atrogriseum TaxID=1093897 RepID=A0AAJ0BQT5_9PEZI|nr:major facilitator superfamily domain-containing protein [Phialemonium atrogriseum]KAK1762774.1 major facilitator superfamily domain-containing protein [Phialemonium atrogriseum]